MYISTKRVALDPHNNSTVAIKLLKLLAVIISGFSIIYYEFLDFQITAKVVSQSASRALGLLISKDKAFGGMPYECFSECYDALVQSINNYGAAVSNLSIYLPVWHLSPVYPVPSQLQVKLRC